MKKSLKIYHVNVYSQFDFLYVLNQVIPAYSLKDCISRINILYPFESRLLITAPNSKIYHTSKSRKTIIRN